MTQRSNRRVQVFFSRADYRQYLDRLLEYTDRHQVCVLAYCLMPNHVHLVLVPPDKSGLHNVMRPVSMRYAQYLNRSRQSNGIVWQGRYFSAALDDAYLWNAVRYVERNPVRANLVARAECYDWSSAAAHCGLRDDAALSDCSTRRRLKSRVPNWSAWLSGTDDPESIEQLRRNTPKGYPCGSAEFVDDLEQRTGQVMRARAPGRKRKSGTQGK